MTALAVLAFAAGVFAAEAGLFVDGQRINTIAIPDGLPEDIRYAAAELQHYVERRCGGKLPIVETDRLLDVSAAYVGLRAWEVAQHLTVPELTGEGVFVSARKGQVFLLGGGPRGTVHAVSAFLEHRLGVRWYQPSPWGEEVPAQGRVHLAPFEYHHEPSFWFRDISICIDESIVQWAIRNRLNTNLRGRAEGRGGSHEYAVGGHAFSKYIKARYFAAHPEYFPIRNGARYLPRPDSRGKRRIQACTVNPEVVGLFVTGMRRALDASPDRRLVSVSPDDVTRRWCSCPLCNALDTGETMMLHGREQRVVSDRFFLFVNTLAKQIEETHPDARLTTFAYHQYRPIPRRCKVRPNVVVMLCQPGAYNHPIRSGASGQIREYQQNLIFYRYMFKTMWESLPYPRHRILADDLKYAHTLGVVGEHGQSQGKNWGMLGLNWYLHAKLLWDVNQNIDALLDDYYRGYFREAQQPMREYFDLMAKAFRNADGPIGEYRLIAPPIYANRFLKAKLLRDARSLLDRASALAESDRVKRRVRMVEIPFRYAEHYMQGLWAYQRFDDTGREHDLRTAVAEYETAVETAKEGETCWAMVYNFGEGARRWLTEREIPKLRRRLVAEFAWGHREVAPVPRTWRFRFEKEGEGEALGWHRADFDEQGWVEARVDRTWQAQGLAQRDFKGAGWYRVVVNVPEGSALHDTALYFGGVDASAKVWVNGELAGEHQYVPNVSWQQPCKLNASKLIRPGANTIAVRVYTGGGNGGLYRPVQLIADSNVVLLLPSGRTAWGLPEDIKDGPDWELIGSKCNPGATIRTPGRKGKNPYDGAWIEFEFETSERAQYQVWLRVVQYQPEETKTLLIDGQVVGQVRSSPRSGHKGYTELRRAGPPATLDAASHTLRIECSGIRGWIDPISAVLITPDLDTDYEALQAEHTANSIPLVRQE